MKGRLEDLAALGGDPQFGAPLHVGRPHVGDRAAFQGRIEDMLDRRWLTNGGRYVEELERRLAEQLGVEHCVATCNATSGLQIAARAAGVTGDVLVPSFTFVATVHALAWLGLSPVFCDVDPETHSLDPALAADLVTSGTGAIVPVHLWGRSCKIEALEELAGSHGLKLIFDASHAFGCSHAGVPIGGHGDAEVFSFHATKILNAGEGGAIATNDAALAERARLMRNFGFATFDDVVSAGTNAKMSEPAAALALTSLASLDSFVEANRRNYESYRSGLGAIPGISMVEPAAGERHNYQHAVVEVEAKELGISRDALHRLLWAEHVLARRYFAPGVHRMEPYRSQMPDAGARLPATEWLCERTLALPSGGELGPDDVASICALIGFIAQNAEAIGERPLPEPGA